MLDHYEDGLNSEEDLVGVCGHCGEVNHRFLELLADQQHNIENLERDLRGKRGQIRRLQKEADEKLTAHKRYPDAMEILRYWRDTLHPKAIELDGERCRKVLQRLDAGYTVEQLKDCIRGYGAFSYVVDGRRVPHGTPGTRRIDAELIFRDPKRVDQGITFAQEIDRRQQVPSQITVDPLSQQLGPIGQAAVYWATSGFGWYVFPVHPGAKTPATPNGFKDATRDIDRITRYWLRKPHHNIGVATGVQSGIVVLDVDDRNGGNETLAELEAERGVLPETLSVTTPGGGQHYYFLHPGGVIHNTAGYPGIGLDIRGDGGYVLVPPSINDRAKKYEIDNRVAIAEMPLWLTKKLHDYTERLGKLSDGEWAALIAQGAKAGERNTTLTRIAGKYVDKGVTDLDFLVATLIGISQTYFNPPLSHKEVLGVAESILRTDIRTRNRRAQEQQLSLEAAS